MLDFGCGPATAGAAAVDVWGNLELNESDVNYREKLSPGAWRKEHQDKYKSKAAASTPAARTDMRYTGVDVSQSMLDSAKVLLNGTLPKATFWDKIGDVVKRCHSTGERFDFINLSYTLNEMASDPMRRAAVTLLFEMLDIGGCMVIIENGSPVGSHTVRTARQLVLDSFGTRASVESKTRGNDGDSRRGKDTKARNLSASKNGNTESFMLSAPRQLQHDEVAASVLAPCTHDRECPLRDGFWCSFSQKVHSGKIHKGNEEKFSYVILRKIARNGTGAISSADAETAEGVWTDVSARAPVANSPSPLQVLRDSSNSPRKDIDALLHNVDWEEYTPPLHREEWGRILRSPIKKKGHILMDVCQSDGSVARNTLTRASIPQIPALYSALRRITWGGLYPALQSGEAGSRSRESAFSAQQVHEKSRRHDSHRVQEETVSSVRKLDLSSVAARRAAEVQLSTLQKAERVSRVSPGAPSAPSAQLLGGAAGGRRRTRAVQGAALRAHAARRKEQQAEEEN